MADKETTEESEQPTPAGDFSTWLASMEAALGGRADSNVPCGTCTACCTSSQFVHIAPDETDALAHIPNELLFPAPRLPHGHVLMGYDQNGHCPMLVDHQCTIYTHRPRTCRTYDCRVLPAAAVQLDEDEKMQIAERARAWRFTYPSSVDRAQHDAVKSAAIFLEQHRDRLPDGAVPRNATALAVLAIEVHRSFLDNDPATGDVIVAAPDLHSVSGRALSVRRGSA